MRGTPTSLPITLRAISSIANQRALLRKHLVEAVEPDGLVAADELRKLVGSIRSAQCVPLHVVHLQKLSQCMDVLLSW